MDHPGPEPSRRIATVIEFPLALKKAQGRGGFLAGKALAGKTVLKLPPAILCPSEKAHRGAFRKIGSRGEKDAKRGFFRHRDAGRQSAARRSGSPGHSPAGAKILEKRRARTVEIRFAHAKKRAIRRGYLEYPD